MDRTRLEEVDYEWPTSEDCGLISGRLEHEGLVAYEKDRIPKDTIEEEPS